MFVVHPIIQKKKNQRLLIAGPCGAESEEQVFATAAALHQQGNIDLFRCGIWKPRSSPKSFEGVGENALVWLQEIQKKYQIQSCIEIVSPQHLEIALRYNITHFWIGARTTVNPFLVQGIADAVAGTDISIMIKNPIAPDINLWIGAFERFAKLGITKMAAIHRGFLTSETGVYRNNPLWKIPIELKRLHPEIPIFCDPSHIAGDKKYIYEIAQKALFLGTDGLMIEVHQTPEISLSDKKQQLTPKEFAQLIHSLNISTATNTQDTLLQQYREIIDELDKEICLILSKRFEAVKQIANYKKEKNISLSQIDRWKQVMENIYKECENKHIDISFMKKIMELLHEESIRIQENITKEKI